jgi:hypothetical protein
VQDAQELQAIVELSLKLGAAGSAKAILRATLRSGRFVPGVPGVSSGLPPCSIGRSDEKNVPMLVCFWELFAELDAEPDSRCT